MLCNHVYCRCFRWNSSKRSLIFEPKPIVVRFESGRLKEWTSDSEVLSWQIQSKSVWLRHTSQSEMLGTLCLFLISVLLIYSSDEFGRFGWGCCVALWITEEFRLKTTCLGLKKSLKNFRWKRLLTMRLTSLTNPSLSLFFLIVGHLFRNLQIYILKVIRDKA